MECADIKFVYFDSINLRHEINRDEPLSKFQYLEKYRDNLKILFTTIEEPMSEYSIARCIKCAEILGDIKISQKTIDFLAKYMHHNFNDGLLDLIPTLYMPNNMYSAKDYFDSCYWFIYSYYGTELMNLNYEDYDTGNSNLDDLFRYQKSLLLNNYDASFALFNNMNVVAIIIAYIRYHNIDNYDLIDEYISKPDYYNEKLKLNNICITKNFHYDVDNTRYLFDHMEEIIEKEHKEIR